DRRRLDVPNAEVLPNAYPRPASLSPRERPPDPARPVLLFVGLLIYAPNIDAARFLVHEILPLVRASAPHAEVHLVGKHGAEVADAGFRLFDAQYAPELVRAVVQRIARSALTSARG